MINHKYFIFNLYTNIFLLYYHINFNTLIYFCSTSINIDTTFIFFYNIIGVQKNTDGVLVNIISVIKKFVRILNIYNNFYAKKVCKYKIKKAGFNFRLLYHNS